MFLVALPEIQNRDPRHAVQSCLFGTKTLYSKLNYQDAFKAGGRILFVFLIAARRSKEH